MFCCNKFTEFTETVNENTDGIDKVMYCSITTVPVAFYWACSDDTVHYKSKNSEFLRSQMCNYVAYNRFYKRRFLHLYLLFLFPCMPKLNACNIP